VADDGSFNVKVDALKNEKKAPRSQTIFHAQLNTDLSITLMTRVINMFLHKARIKIYVLIVGFCVE